MAGLGTLGGGGLLAGKSLAVLGAGLLAGALGGGALVGSGAVHFGPNQGGNAGAGGGLQLVPCPDQGPVIGTIPRNQQVLVTAKSADGGWLQLYWPAPGIERAWTKAGPLQLEGDLASLPVARCEAPLPATPRPTVEPTATPEPTPTPTPEPTPSPTPTTAPTASPTAAANAAPKVSGLTISTQTISYDQGAYCASAPKSVTFAVSVSDADGLASVNLWYRPPGATKYLAKPMTPSGGKYVATLDTTADNLKTAGELRYYVLAKDQNASPETTKLPKSGYQALTVKVCKNAGPKITLLTATPTSIIANPLSVVGCAGSTLSELRARATDVDGIKGIKLFFKKPGATAYTGREFSLASGTWYSFINTVGTVDNIVRPGNISWYVVATDTKGATTKSAVKTIKVTRCDTEASFDFGSITSAVYNQSTCSPNRVTVQVYADDADVGYPSENLKVAVYWEAHNNRGGTSGSYSGKVTADYQKGNYFLAYISTVGWVNPGSWTLTLYATSTDPYGGTSKSSTVPNGLSVYGSCVIP